MSVGIPAVAVVAVEALWRGRRCILSRSESEGEGAGPSIRPFGLNTRYQRLREKQKRRFKENVCMSYVSEVSIPRPLSE